MDYVRTRWMAASAFLLVIGLLGACQDPRSAGRDVGASKQATPAPSGAVSDTATRDPQQDARSRSQSDLAETPHSQQRQCRFEVDGKVLVDGVCEVFPMGDGGYTLNTWTAGKPPNSHFAVVIPQGDGSAEASWNADPDDDKAMDSLGVVTLNEGCWINDRARICAR